MKQITCDRCKKTGEKRFEDPIHPGMSWLATEVVVTQPGARGITYDLCAECTYFLHQWITKKS
jgi:hypothetical protein